MSLKDEKLWELKEAAKWSLGLEEKKRAIEALVNDYGGEALPALAEIKDTTAYEEIKKTCIEAIISAGKDHVHTVVMKENHLVKGSSVPTKAKNKSGKSKKSKKGRRR